MTKSTIDFETRSKAEIRDGLSQYARDDSTDSLMLAYSVPDQRRVEQWNADLDGEIGVVDKDGIPEVLRKIIEEGGELHAHNAAFERYIWHYVMHRRLGWPDVPLERWHCTAAKAAHANMPRQLDALCVRLGFQAGKDKDGKRLIKLLSLPQKITKTAEKAGRVEGKVRFDHKGVPHFWEDDEAEYENFRKYNRQDVVAEDMADRKLPDWPESERKVWRLDRRINERGLPFDRAFCEGAVKLYDVTSQKMNEELQQITGGAVTAASQVPALKQWVNERVNFGDSMTAPYIDEWLSVNGERPELSDVARVLDIRRQAGSAAVKKYMAALAGADSDDRIRECLLYYGAATGRWAGRGIQPHNFVRDETKPEYMHEAITIGDYDLCALVADKPGAEGIFDMLKGCARGIIKAAEGKTLVISDFAGIEARVLHWLCDNERALNLFRNNQDAYIEAACEIYGVSHNEIATLEGGKWVIKKEHKDKRQVGKVSELALGYGMGAEKFQGTAKTMASVDLDLEVSQQVVKKWRDMNPEVTRLWSQLNRAALHVTKTKRTVRLGKMTLGWDTKKFLWIQLPSGRRLYYYDARITKNEDWGTPELTYLDGEKGKGGLRTKTYGGKLVENVVQAISRDLLVHSMQIIDDAGMDLILHVHDESVTEVDEATAKESKAFIHKAMTTLPPWASGLPFDAETNVSKRYRKF